MRPGHIDRLQRKRAFARLEMNLAQRDPFNILHVGLTAHEAIVLHAPQWRIMRFDDLCSHRVTIKTQFHGRTHIGRRTGIKQLHGIGSGLPHFTIPGDGVIHTRPIGEEGIIGPTVRPFDIPMAFAIPGRHLGNLLIRMAHHEGPVIKIRAVVSQHLRLEIRHNLRQLRRDLRLLVVDRGSLTGIRQHVVKIALIIKPILGCARRCARLPMVHDGAFRPVVIIAPEQRREAHAIERFASRQFHPGDLRQGRQHIHHRAELGHLGPGLNFRRPTQRKWRTHPTLIRRSFATAHATIPTRAIGTIVGKVDHDRIVRDLKRIEFVHDAAHVPVDVLTHRERRPRMVELIPRCRRMIRRKLKVLELIPPPIRHLHRRVRRVVAQINEEGFISTLFNEIHGSVREVVDHEAIARHHLSVVLQHGAEVVPPVARTKTIKLFKPAGVGMVGILHAAVPFAERSRAITGFLKKLPNHFLVRIHPFASFRSRINPAASMMPARQKLCPRRRTHRTDIKPVKNRPFPREPIDVRRVQYRVATDT